MTPGRAPRRGDIVWVSLGPRAGHEQEGRRPAIVLSPESYNAKVGLAVMCPVTRRVNGYPFEVAIPDGLPVTGVVLSDQVRSMDWREASAEFVCEAPGATLQAVRQMLGALIGA